MQNNSKIYWNIFGLRALHGANDDRKLHALIRTVRDRRPPHNGDASNDVVRLDGELNFEVAEDRKQDRLGFDDRKPMR